MHYVCSAHCTLCMCSSCICTPCTQCTYTHRIQRIQRDFSIDIFYRTIRFPIRKGNNLWNERRIIFFFLTFQWRKMMKMLVCCAIAEFCLWCEMKDNGCGKERKLTKKRERVRGEDGKRNGNSQNALDREKSRERKKWNSIRGTCSSLSYEKHETDREENLTYFGVFRLCSDLPNAESARLAHTWACDVESA